MNRAWLLLTLCFCLAVPSAYANVHFEALEKLPPGEQFRQLSLMLLVSAGVSPELNSAILEAVPESDVAVLKPDDFTTPLARIVDQGSMLAGAARMFEFANENETSIRARMTELETVNPVLISMVDLNGMTEDTIIIRNAIADSIEYSRLLDSDFGREQVLSYRVHTVYLRNVMEYEDFSQELNRLTGEAIASVGGKLDAYQRMFEEETGSSTFDRHIEAAESIYTSKEEFNKRAGKEMEELIQNMIDMETDPGN